MKFALILLSSTFFAATISCGGAPYQPADAGDPCGDYEAVCSVAGDALLVCNADSFTVEYTCANGCVAASPWFSVGPPPISEVCCDNPNDGGSERVCVETQNQEKRVLSTFDENNSFIEKRDL
jgi:hypothetical protein